MDELIMQQLPYVERLARRHPLYRQDDVYGEGVLGLVKAARRYTPKAGVKFISYARHRIHGQIWDFLSYVNNKKCHTELNEFIACNREQNPVTQAIKNELAVAVYAAINTLKARHQIVICGLLEQKKTKEIAKEMQCTEGRVSQLQKQAFMCMRKQCLQLR